MLNITVEELWAGIRNRVVNFHPSLRDRIRLILASILIGLGLVVTVSLWILGNQAVEQQIRKDVFLAGGYLRTQIALERSQLRSQMRSISTDPDVREILSDPTSPAEIVGPKIDEIRKRIGVDGMRVINPKGTTWVLSGRTPRTFPNWLAVDLSALAKAKEPLDRRFSPFSGGFMLGSVVPVKANGRLVGAVSGFRIFNKDMIKDLAKSLGSELAVIFEAMVASASIRTPDSLPNDGEFHMVEIDGETYGVQYVVIEESEDSGQVGLMVMRSVSKTTAPMRRLTTLLLSFLGVALAIGMVLANWLSKSITKPITQVVNAARVIEAGDWPDPVQVDRVDELGVLASVFNEMTQSVRASKERLLAMADADPLTECMNHRAFHERLHDVLSNEPASLLLIDLDHFKAYNDRHGLASGDQLLRSTAMIIQQHLPDNAILARYGGEEFAVLLPSFDLDSAQKVGERVKEALAYEACTVSIGCADSLQASREPAGLIIASELALNRAKQLGRDRVCRFDHVPGAETASDPFQLHRLLQDASLATIQALAAAVDAKDTYTEGHSRRVAEYASDLARYLGRKEAEVDLIYRTGTLHDVGKIGVPDSILKKPGRLTDEERAIMETHPVLGEVIVRKAPQLEDTIPGVRHHHERWDGKGYPDGLTGEHIPFMARVLAVADTFDAMTSDRPYRKGMDWDVSLEAIREGAGTQFDPSMAHAFVRLMRSRELRQAA